MRTLYQTLEQLALELPYGDDFSQTTRALFLVYRDEIWYLPWSDRQAAHDKLCEGHVVQNLIALVLREMQRHARAILVEQGRGGIFDQSGCPVLPPEDAAIVQRAWDALGNAPAWTAFESQIDKLASRYAKED
jgi:hypothetical protein